MENQDLTPRLVLVVALALAGPASGQEAVPRDAVTEAGSAAAVDTKPFEQVVKLWKAGLSEEFLLRKVEREPVVYRLSTDDIIACKAAGVPESIIEAMMKTGGTGGNRGSSPSSRTRFAGSTRETRRETPFFRWGRSWSSFSSVRTTHPPTAAVSSGA